MMEWFQKLFINSRKGELSEATVRIIIVLVIIVLGAAAVFMKFKDFKDMFS